MLWLALGLNAAMAIIETLAGFRADSTGLLADALDMMTDAAAYAIALAAIGRSLAFKARAAAINGSLVLRVLAEVIREALAILGEPREAGARLWAETPHGIQ